MVIVLALIWYAALRLFHHGRTLTGLSISAVAQDLDAARAAGLRVRRLQMLAFAISGLIIGSTGFTRRADPCARKRQRCRLRDERLCGRRRRRHRQRQPARCSAAHWSACSRCTRPMNTAASFPNAVTLGLLVAVLMIKPEGLFGTPAARKV